MALISVVLAAALLEYLLIGYAVGRARERYGVAAPKVTGHEIFERCYRVQMNTLELLVVMIPSIFLFGHYVSAVWAAALGGVYVIGRAWYFFAYVRAPAKRGPAYALSLAPIVVLTVGGLIGALRTVIRS